jgi:hypothetical protein
LPSLPDHWREIAFIAFHCGGRPAFEPATGPVLPKHPYQPDISRMLQKRTRTMGYTVSWDGSVAKAFVFEAVALSDG